jgi:hypothetical protein
MKVLLYLVLAPFLFLAFVIVGSLLWMAVGLGTGIVAILAESITVGAANFACHFVSERRASRIKQWLDRNGIGVVRKD